MKPSQWVIIGVVGVLAAGGIALMAWSPNSDDTVTFRQDAPGFQTDDGLTYAGRLIEHARALDSSGARVTCKQAEDDLKDELDSRGRPTQAEDWNILVDPCNDIIAGRFGEAIAYLDAKVRGTN